MAKVTLESIAKKMGVSKVAVHKALNDKKGVSEPLRKKIKDYAISVGYVVKSSKIDFKNKRFIFFVNQDFFLTPSEQFYSPIFYALSFECNAAGSTLQVAFIEKKNTVERLNSVIESFKPDGLFFAGEASASIIKFFRSLDIPTVYIDFYSPLYEENYVYIDNYQSGYRLTKYLVSKGHKEIGFIGNIDSTQAIADRYFGYAKALREENLFLNPNWHINQNIEKTNTMKETPFDKMPSALICHCDAAAQWLYTLLSLRGLKVPEDVSVVSFDDTVLCDNLLPPLTSIGAKKDYLAKTAFTLMADVMRQPKKKTHRMIVPTLTERRSVKVWQGRS